MRLVDADALKEDCRMANDCKDCKTYVRDCEYDRIYTKMDFCGWLDDAPTVDAVPVRHGRWIYHIDDLFPAESTQECDQCHEEQPLTCGDNFCPNCGAKMTGKDGDGNDS